MELTRREPSPAPARSAATSAATWCRSPPRTRSRPARAAAARLRPRLAVHGRARTGDTLPERMDERRRSWLAGARANARGRRAVPRSSRRAARRSSHQLSREWTRIGRSLAADVRFDDPTVSRRHALIVRQPDGVRVLDDRSLNGVFVNGERVEWRALRDGDEIVVGRYRLHFVDVPVVSGTRELRRRVSAAGNSGLNHRRRAAYQCAARWQSRSRSSPRRAAPARRRRCAR